MDPLLLAFGRLLRACVLTAVGEAAEACRVLDTRGDVPERLPRYIARLDRLVRLLIAVAMGDLATVDALAPAMRALGADVEARLAEALSVGLAGDEPRAVRLLTELLPGHGRRAGESASAPRWPGSALLQRIGTPGAVAGRARPGARPAQPGGAATAGVDPRPRHPDQPRLRRAGGRPTPSGSATRTRSPPRPPRRSAGMRRSYPDVGRHRELGFRPDDPAGAADRARARGARAARPSAAATPTSPGRSSSARTP